MGVNLNGLSEGAARAVITALRRHVPSREWQEIEEAIKLNGAGRLLT